MTKRSWIRALFAPTAARTIRKAPPRVRLAAEELETRWVPSIVVNNPTDTPVSGETDLRQAIAQANATTGGDAITFDSTVFSTPQTITLGGTQLELSNTTGPETITGPAAGVTVSGGGQSRVFQVDGGVTASISGLTITGGRTAGNGGGLINYGGTLTLTDCTVTGNSPPNNVVNRSGGGVYNDGALTLTNCTISGNSASEGGGLDNNQGTVTLTNTTVSGNSATLEGGGVLNQGTATLTNCTVSDNSGVGVMTETEDGTTTMINCTVSGNSGYGVFNDGGTTLTDCTVSGNSGGGLYTSSQFPGLGDPSDYSSTTLTNCTVSGNSSGGLDTLFGNVTLTTCTVNGNGGGLRTVYGTTTLTNCTVSDSSGQPGLSADESTLTLTDCTISGNSGGGIQRATPGRASPIAPSAVTPRATVAA